MSDTPPQLTDSYVAYRDQAANEAAYAQMEQAAAQPQQGQPGQQSQGQQPQGQPQQPTQETTKAPPLMADAGTSSMIDAEVQRLAAPPFDKSRYANPEEALRERAMSNLGMSSDTYGSNTYSNVPPNIPGFQANVPGFDGATEANNPYSMHAVARDIKRIPDDIRNDLIVAPFTVAGDLWMAANRLQIPRGIYMGVHDAVTSVFKMADSLDSWSTEKFADWHMSALNAAIGHDRGAGLLSGYHLLSGSDVQQAEATGAGKEFSSAGVVSKVTNPLDVQQPRNPVGVAVKNVSQFITGMMFAGNQLRAVGLPTDLAGWSGRGVTAAQGFLAQFESFDGAQHRLSDLVQSVPALRNPVTQFLSSKPGDNEVEGRLKNALEGSIVGQAAEGVLSGIKMLRAAMTAKGAAQDIVEAAADRPPPPASAGIDALGEEAKEGEKAPTVQMSMDNWGVPRPATSQQTKMVAAADHVEQEGMTPEEVGAPKAEEPAIAINFRRIDTSDDIKDAMQNLADKFSDNIDQARRGVQTFQQTQLGAQAEDAWKTLMDRRVGEPLNDTQTLAARQLWASSASKTMELADIATKAPTVENLYAFRKMLITHAAIQEQVIAARTETARALSSWRIPAGEDPLRLEGMVQQLSSDAGLKGGHDAALALAQKVNELATGGNWNDIGNMVEKGALAKTRDGVLEAWTNGLLTAPMTHVKVMASNAATLAMRIGERAVGAKISNALGDADGVATGEASAQVAGLLGGLKDAFLFAGKLAMSRLEPSEGGGLLDQGQFAMPELGDDPLSNAIKAAKTGQYSLSANGSSEYMQNQGAISAETLGMADSSAMGKGMDMLGQVVRAPGRSLTAEHDFFRSIGYRMELNAQAVRTATQDVNAGRITQEALGDRIAQIVANPPPQVRMDAVNGTLYQTFTDAPGKFTEMIGNMRQEYPLLRVILPFYKIPSRIMSFTFERTPLAPLMSTFRENFAAGGARQSLAVAQMGLGSGLMMATADAVLSGQITGAGPQDKGLRATMENEGWQPYSIKSGGKWFQYNRIEPSGSSMAMAADAVEAMRNFHSQVNGDDPDTANLGLATVAAIANDITSKSYLQGLSNFFGAIADPASNGKKAIDALAGSTVPAGVAAIDRLTDPYKREVYRMIDAIRSRTPGVSEGLPPQANLWGEPVQNASGEGKAFDLLSPVGTRQIANEPIDKELIRQGIDIPRTPSRTSLDGVTLDLNRIDPKMYSRFQQLAGNAYKGPDGLGLKDSLNALVSGGHPMSPAYQRLTDGPDGSKADMIRDVVNEYREGAKAELMHEYPQLQGMVQEGQAAKQQIKAGTQ